MTIRAVRRVVIWVLLEVLLGTFWWSLAVFWRSFGGLLVVFWRGGRLAGT